MPFHIFLVEDEPAIRVQLTALLERSGYVCTAPDRFEGVAEEILASGAQLVLLDLNLPGCDGQEICADLRRAAPRLPIMVVTSRDNPLDELMSVQLGADDFLTKPYHPQILLARMARLLQRSYPAENSPRLRRGELELDLGRSLLLTRNEARILQRLMTGEGDIVSRSALMDALWQSDAFVDDNTLTVNVTRLRRKLEELGLTDCLRTRQGQGYQLCL